MTGARAALAGAVAIVLAGCGGAGGHGATAAGPPLHLAPTTDLAQGADLSWLIDLEPQRVTADADLLPAIDALLSRAQVTSLAEKNGGVDPLSLAELVIASYDGGTTLYLARGAVVPESIEKAFTARAGGVDGRAVDRHDPSGDIVRVWGTVRGDRAQVATFGRDAVGLEVGRFGPLRVAELFAEGRLKRAVPALRVGPLARAAELLEAPAGGGDDGVDTPVRAFALGPFEGESGRALGGLLAASTAAAVGARPARVAGHAALACTLVLTGGWGAKAAEAAERLRIAFDAFTATGLARLAGLDRPLGSVQVEGLPDALRLTVALDPLALSRGVRAAMGAEIAEIMAY